eukprot:6003638-Amphidinium_carterae.1
MSFLPCSLGLPTDQLSQGVQSQPQLPRRLAQGRQTVQAPKAQPKKRRRYTVRMPGPLVGLSPKNSDGSACSPICFSWHLQGCDRKVTNGACDRGKHVCMPHAARADGAVIPLGMGPMPARRRAELLHCSYRSIDDAPRADAVILPEFEAVMVEVCAGNAVLSQFFQGRGWT